MLKTTALCMRRSKMAAATTQVAEDLAQFLERQVRGHIQTYALMAAEMMLRTGTSAGFPTSCSEPSTSGIGLRLDKVLRFPTERCLPTSREGLHFAVLSMSAFASSNGRISTTYVGSRIFSAMG